MRTPGVIGLASAAPDSSLPGHVRVEAMAGSGGRREIQAAITSSGTNWVTAIAELPGRPTQSAAAGHLHVTLHGHVHNREERAHRAASAGIDGDAGLVLEVVRQQGARGLAALDGTFSGVVVDEDARTVSLVSDVTGEYPTYWVLHGKRFAFAPSLAATLRMARVVPQLDLHAAADYLHYGFVLGDRTLARGVSLVPAGSVVTYCWHDNSVTVTRVQSPADLFAPVRQTREQYLEATRVAFNDASRRAAATDLRLGLSLSGGLDSRAVLSAIDTASRSVATYTVGARLCADDVIAGKLARLAGTRHHFLELDDRYLKDFLPNFEQMLSLTDGMYLSHGLTEILALRAVRTAGIDVLLRGHCGELAKTDLAWPLHTDRRVFATPSTGELSDYLFTRVNYITPGFDAAQLFVEEHRPALRGAARASLDDALSGVALPAPDVCAYLYLTQHHRRFTIPSLELFRTEVDVRLPFADPRFLRTLFSGRAEWRAGTDVHRYVTGQNDARLLRVRNSNTGAPGSAGPLLERLADPVNSVLKRLNAPGYRHYHQFDNWMKQELLSTVADVLLDRTTVGRGLLDRGAVARVIDETRQGTADHAYLLQVLLALELWQRQAEAVYQA